MRTRVPAAVALAVLTIAAAGCGSAGTGGVVAAGDMGKGKQLFTERCAACHTLADANATGKVGPDLDTSFGPDHRQGMKEETIRQVVADQIRWAGNYEAENAPTMPKDLVRGSDLDAVASYVAYVAGQPDHNVAAPPPPPTTKPPAGGGGGGGGNLAAGKKAFADNGCAACHTLTAAGASGKVGPDLDKLKTYASNAKKPLDAFIHESIVDPNAYIEKGYPKGVMPESFSSLPKSTLDALVAFLAASAKS